MNVFSEIPVMGNNIKKKPIEETGKDYTQQFI